MRWLPEYGIGIVALGNLTYTSWGGVITSATDALAATGAMQPRMPVPSPALVAAREAITRLVNNWDDALADSVAAMNLKLDDSWNYRRTRLIALHSDVGESCRNEGPFVVENALRGRWRMRCGASKGLEVSITLAPTVPPKVQYLDVQVADFSGPLAAPPTCPVSVQRP